jgi:hypothetical protein
VNENILPEALSIGIDYNLFWDLNPTLLKPFFKAHQLKQDRYMQEQSTISYWNGIYVAHAISASFGSKFPDKPLKLFKTLEEVEKENRPLTEAEIIEERNKFVEGLKLMEINFKSRNIKKD